MPFWRIALLLITTINKSRKGIVRHLYTFFTNKTAKASDNTNRELKIKYLKPKRKSYAMDVGLFYGVCKIEHAPFGVWILHKDATVVMATEIHPRKFLHKDLDPDKPETQTMNKF